MLQGFTRKCRLGINASALFFFCKKVGLIILRKKNPRDYMMLAWWPVCALWLTDMLAVRSNYGWHGSISYIDPYASHWSWLLGSPYLRIFGSIDLDQCYWITSFFTKDQCSGQQSTWAVSNCPVDNGHHVSLVLEGVTYIVIARIFLTVLVWRATCACIMLWKLSCPSCHKYKNNNHGISSCFI